MSKSTRILLAGLGLAATLGAILGALDARPLPSVSAGPPAVEQTRALVARAAAAGCEFEAGADLSAFAACVEGATR